MKKKMSLPPFLKNIHPPLVAKRTNFVFASIKCDICPCKSTQPGVRTLFRALCTFSQHLSPIMCPDLSVKCELQESCCSFIFCFCKGVEFTLGSVDGCLSYPRISKMILRGDWLHHQVWMTRVRIPVTSVNAPMGLL